MCKFGLFCGNDSGSFSQRSVGKSSSWRFQNCSPVLDFTQLPNEYLDFLKNGKGYRIDRRILAILRVFAMIAR